MVSEMHRRDTHTRVPTKQGYAYAGAHQDRRILVTADVLIAACAQEAGIGVLHYDARFDRLAEVMGFESRWIAPAGSL